MLKRVLWPLRDALAALIRTEVPSCQAGDQVFLNDTLDHAVRLIEMVETERDMLTGLIDMHLSLSQARTNDVISFLTIVSVDLHPADLPRRHLGHEFRSRRRSPWNMPELKAYYGYPAALLFMAGRLRSA